MTNQLRLDFVQSCQTARSILNSGDFEKAKSAVDALKPESSLEKRVQLFWYSKIELRNGNYQASLDSIQQARTQYGDHIGLLINELECYYMMSDVFMWKKKYREIATLLPQILPLLSPLTILQVAASFGRFQEEQGWIAEALESYEMALRHSKVDVEPELYTSLTSHYLRVCCQFRLKAKSLEAYKNLLFLREGYPTAFHRSTVQHALVLAECFLLGANAAIERMNSIWENIDNDNRRLVLVDLMDELVILGMINEAEALLAKSSTISGFDGFEREIIRLLKEKAPLDGPRLNQCLQGLTPACGLRVIDHNLRLLKTADESVERLRQLNILLEELPAGSRQMWRSRLAANGARDVEFQITFDRESGVLSAGNRAWSLGRQKILKEVMLALTEKSQLPLADFCERVWEAELDESYYHRIRNVVARVNKGLNDLVGHPSVIELNTQQIRLNQQVKITQ